MSDEGWAAMPNLWVRDPHITIQAKMVYIVLSSHIGGAGGAYVMHIEKLVTESGCSRSAVKRALAELEQREMVSVERRKQGRMNIANVYRLASPTVTIGLEGSVPPEPTSVLTEPTVGPTRTGSTEEQEKKNTDTARLTDFDIWWDAYPRKVARPDALRAYDKARAKGIAARVLLDAAVAFKRDRNREDRYTPYPATWLNRESWNDGPQPERKPERRPTQLTTRSSLYAGLG